MFRGVGNAILTQSHGKLVDPRNQLEDLIDTIPITICNETLYVVRGAPKTLLAIPRLFANRTIIRVRRVESAIYDEYCIMTKSSHRNRILRWHNRENIFKQKIKLTQHGK